MCSAAARKMVSIMQRIRPPCTILLLRTRCVPKRAMRDPSLPSCCILNFERNTACSVDSRCSERCFPSLTNTSCCFLLQHQDVAPGALSHQLVPLLFFTSHTVTMILVKMIVIVTMIKLRVKHRKGEENTENIEKVRVIRRNSRGWNFSAIMHRVGLTQERISKEKRKSELSTWRAS